jgi:Zn/Cd-binding protein ZinT
MAQQTAVDWLVEQFKKRGYIKDLVPHLLLEQTKDMEKDQIKSAYNKGYQDGEIDSLDAKDGDVQFFEDAEQYYNETYNAQ